MEPRRGVTEMGLCVVPCPTQIKVTFLTAFFCTALTVLGKNKNLPLKPSSMFTVCLYCSSDSSHSI